MNKIPEKNKLYFKTVINRAIEYGDIKLTDNIKFWVVRNRSEEFVKSINAKDLLDMMDDENKIIDFNIYSFISEIIKHPLCVNTKGSKKYFSGFMYWEELEIPSENVSIEEIKAMIGM